MPLFLILLIVPLIEIGLFITIGQRIGVWPTLGLVLVTAVAGSILLRQQGLGVLRQLQSDVASRRIPAGPLAHGAVIVVAGLLLLTPGFLTDTIGLLLFVPAVRTWLWRILAARIATISRTQSTASRDPRSRRVVDLDSDEFEVHDPDSSSRRDNHSAGNGAWQDSDRP